MQNFYILIITNIDLYRLEAEFSTFFIIACPVWMWLLFHVCNGVCKLLICVYCVQAHVRLVLRSGRLYSELDLLNTPGVKV